MQKIHLIAIGGSAMHNMALALHEKGHEITGSDDEINEPSRSRLREKGLLPEEIGWFPEKVTRELDAVILGMHARADNPELLRAKELGIKIYSYPEYVYEATRLKKRIVVGGSHGKTTITAMILHVMHFHRINTDYLVGAQLPGFKNMVHFSEDSEYAVIEGDEYLSSPIDRRPKFHLYHPDIAIISGIAWDHINVFPTFENYLDQFRKFIDLIQPGGTLVYCREDPALEKIASDSGRTDIAVIPYSIPEHIVQNGETSVISENRTVPLRIFGDHNLMNLTGARLVCNRIGITNEMFFDAIQSFSGAAKRLELVFKSGSFSFYKDFAHSPSKLRATTSAVSRQFPNRRVVACMELHTFSSLNEQFLSEYAGSMDLPAEAIVYYNPHTIAHKKLREIDPGQVHNAFRRDDLKVFTSSPEFISYLKQQKWENSVLLMMSSGNFDGLNFEVMANDLSRNEPAS